MPPKNTNVPGAKTPLTEHEIPALMVPLLRAAPLALAVSGGPDSTQLMYMVAAHRTGALVHVLSVDHGLRPGSAEELQQVARLAGDLGLPHTILRWEGLKPETGVQAAARKARYRLMAEWCIDHGFTNLVTAHNLDDQAETVLMRLARGSGADGLAAMNHKTDIFGVTLLRPLLGVPHNRLVASLAAEARTAIEDPSNADPKFERVRLRQARPARDQLGLEDKALAATARRMARAVAALEQMAAQAISRHAEFSEFGHCVIHTQGFLEEPDEVIIRGLARCLNAVGGGRRPPGDEQLEGVLAALKEGSAKPVTLAGCRAVFRGGQLVLGREFGRISELEMPFSPSGKMVWDNRFEIGSAGSDTLGVTVGPLTPADWVRLKPVRPHLPAFVGHSLPALRRNGQLVAAPLAGFGAHEFSAKFANDSVPILGRKCPE